MVKGPEGFGLNPSSNNLHWVQALHSDYSRSTMDLIIRLVRCDEWPFKWHNTVTAPLVKEPLIIFFSGNNSVAFFTHSSSFFPPLDPCPTRNHPYSPFQRRFTQQNKHNLLIFWSVSPHALRKWNNKSLFVDKERRIEKFFFFVSTLSERS